MNLRPTEVSIDIQKGQKIYVASDFHLGAPNASDSFEREQKLIRWLQQISKDAAAIFFVGDVFDFWFEYRTVVPKGFVRFQAEVARITDQGIPVYVFLGNHDLWMKEYFTTELGVRMVENAMTLLTGNMQCFLAHGDGLGDSSKKYKLIKKIFTNPFLQWSYRWLHPDLGVPLARFFSSNSRKKGESVKDENSILIEYSKKIESSDHHDLYIFGHVHRALNVSIGEHSRYINLGEWFDQCHYLELDEKSAEIRRFTD